MKKEPAREIVQELIKGHTVVLGDQYPTGLKILAELKKRVSQKKEGEKFEEYRESRSKYHEISSRLLVPVQDNQIALRKKPDIGWLNKLYPDSSDFYLPFPKIQGLNSSWQWYINGIEYPGVPGKIHPWYGVYFPTRKDHLHLFYYWLRKYKGPKNRAIDVGTGCGVLAFQMLNAGFEFVEGTDLNPASVYSANESANSLGFVDRFTAGESDLLAGTSEAELIVFNPPWLPVQNDADGLDHAIYYETGLFARFFDQAAERLPEHGRLVFIFSNLGRKEELTADHPVEQELENHKRFKKVKLIIRKAEPASRKTRRRDNRKEEYVELWELARQ